MTKLQEKEVTEKLNIFFKNTNRFDIIDQIKMQGLPKVIYIFDAKYLKMMNAYFGKHIKIKLNEPVNGFKKDNMFMSWMEREIDQNLGLIKEQKKRSTEN